MTKRYTMYFGKNEFKLAMGILSFRHLYTMDKIENKKSETYVNERKGICVEVKQSPFYISILAKQHSFTENSYERAYNIIHRLIT